MSATRTPSARRGSILVLCCLLALIASTLSVSAPSVAYADGDGDDTIMYLDTLGNGKCTQPGPDEPAPETKMLSTDLILMTEMMTLWFAVL